MQVVLQCLHGLNTSWLTWWCGWLRPCVRLLQRLCWLNVCPSSCDDCVLVQLQAFIASCRVEVVLLHVHVVVLHSTLLVARKAQSLGSWHRQRSRALGAELSCVKFALGSFASLPLMAVGVAVHVAETLPHIGH